METKIRTLNADEIECRVQSVTEKGCILLIYKDARVDMRILDEVFGIDGWQRTHEVINGNLFCTIEIWSASRNCWVKKQDVGTESNTEKEKGEASDSFKRAGFNIGIGRELYSAPFTWVNLEKDEVWTKDGKWFLQKGIKFFVKEIGYDEKREINKLVIVDQNKKVRYTLGQKLQETSKMPEPIPAPKRDERLPIALQCVKEAASLSALETVWKGWECFHNDNTFLTAVKMKKETFKN